MELISEDILSKKCHINMGPILNIYRVTFVIVYVNKFHSRISVLSEIVRIRTTPSVLRKVNSIQTSILYRNK
jgi:hypothetical protein